MKFLSPSSSPSSATTTTTTTAHTAYSIRPLTTMLRRLLCFNGLPTHPSNNPETSSIELNHPKPCFRTEYGCDKAEPGLVAKLMGLESMPIFELANTQMNSGLIRRSKSVDCDSKREKESQHRRVKSSLSFPEFPRFLVLEDFFVLSFEDSEEVKGIRSKSRRRRTERSRRRKKEKQSVPKEMKKENRDPEEFDVRIIHESSDKPNHEEEGEEGSVPKKIEETECNLENSSPVSVLDFPDSTLDPSLPISEEDERSTSSNSRRRLSEELENSHKLPPSPSDEKVSRKTGRKSRTRYGYTREYAEMWDRSCRLVEEDMADSNRRCKNPWTYQRDDGSIGEDCELEILENLLFELVDQLVDG